MELDVCSLTDTSALPNYCTPGTTCHPDATCIQVIPHVCACNPANSYRCKCNPGFTGDGLTCTGSLPVFVADVLKSVQKDDAFHQSVSVLFRLRA